MKLERRRGRVSQEAAVYWCYDQARNLLYAGMMFNPGSRPPDRLRRAEWWPLVDERYTKVVWYPTRWDAQVALSNTVNWEKPRYNTRPSSRRCALYRHYDSSGILLYIGVTNEQSRRDNDHVLTSIWVTFVDRSEARWLQTRKEALLAEKAAIQAEAPVFNVDHAPPGREERIRAYLTSRDRLDLLPVAL